MQARDVPGAALHWASAVAGDRCQGRALPKQQGSGTHHGQALGLLRGGVLPPLQHLHQALEAALVGTVLGCRAWEQAGQHEKGRTERQEAGEQ